MRSKCRRLIPLTLALIAMPAPIAAANEIAKLVAGDAEAFDQFGSSVSISGLSVAVGADWENNGGGTNAGAVYVFVKQSGSWVEQAKLLAADGLANDRLGYAVAIDGDTLVAGAFNDDNGGGNNAGAAYVFVRSGSTWSQQAKLTASDGAASDEFGSAVAITGNTIIVGAWRDDIDGINNAGSAYVYTRSGTVWSEQARLTASDRAASDLLGTSVSISGETAVVGAHSDDHAGGGNAGAAYVFLRSGTTWSEQQKLTAPDAAADDELGYSVSISGDTVVAGARLADAGLDANVGAAYVFVRSGVVWSLQAKLSASNALPEDRFGTAVGISGDNAAITALGDDHAGGSDAGSTYSFVRSGTTWTEKENLVASDAAEFDALGIAVAIDGARYVAGAWWDDGGAGLDTGAAYLFEMCLQPCDTDCNGTVNPFDIQPFIDALQAVGTPCSPCSGDADGNGTVNPFDITAFLSCL